MAGPREPLVFLPALSWERMLPGVPDDPVVFSSRATVRRNLAGHPYPGAATAAEREEVRLVLRKLLRELGGRSLRRRWKNAEWREVARVEGLSTPEMARWWDEAETFLFGRNLAALVNTEDHLLFRSTWRGLHLQEAVGDIRTLDGEASARVEYAFSPEFGHLTASPNRMGTGFQAEVCLFLPAIRFLREADPDVWDQVVRGLVACRVGMDFGERNMPFLRIWNRQTAGKSEERLAAEMEETAKELAEKEMAAREAISKHEALGLLWEDRWARAKATARAALVMDAQEEMELLSWLRWGTLNGRGLVPVELLDLILLRDQPGIWRRGDARTPARAKRLEMLMETFSEENLGELERLFRRKPPRKKRAKRAAAEDGGKAPEGEEAP